MTSTEQQLIRSSFVFPVHQGTLLLARRGNKSRFSAEQWGPVGGGEDPLAREITGVEYDAIAKAFQPTLLQEPRLLSDIKQLAANGKEHPAIIAIRETIEEIFDGEDYLNTLLAGSVSEITYLGAMTNGKYTTPEKEFRNAMWIATINADIKLEKGSHSNIADARTIDSESTFGMSQLGMFELRYNLVLPPKSQDPFAAYRTLAPDQMRLPKALPHWPLFGMPGVAKHYKLTDMQRDITPEQSLAEIVRTHEPYT